jgi:hypothetical protein
VHSDTDTSLAHTRHLNTHAGDPPQAPDPHPRLRPSTSIRNPDSLARLRDDGVARHITSMIPRHPRSGVRSYGLWGGWGDRPVQGRGGGRRCRRRQRGARGRAAGGGPAVDPSKTRRKRQQRQAAIYNKIPANSTDVTWKSCNLPLSLSILHVHSTFQPARRLIDFSGVLVSHSNSNVSPA